MTCTVIHDEASLNRNNTASVMSSGPSKPAYMFGNLSGRLLTKNSMCRSGRFGGSMKIMDGNVGTLLGECHRNRPADT